ncbi:MAG: metallophosphoesterase [Terrimonas sp.]|nr:metallophosphoesterase [Terrimonas sp.]
MRSYSLYTIIGLCAAILLVDIFAFYWLQSITRLIPSALIRQGINIAFWVFTIGLIIAILVLKLRLDHIAAQRKHLLVTSLYGLTVSSFIPKLIFISAITLLYLTHDILYHDQSLLWVPVLGLIAGFLPFFVILYAIFRSLYRFKVHTIRIKSDLLPKNFQGLRIVHISDIHLGSFNARFHIFDKAVKMINDLSPDFIFFTGDLVNNFAYELEGWQDTFNQLSAKQGKFSVLGNHDYGDYHQWKSPEAKKENFEAIKAFHGAIGFRLLLNEGLTIRHAESSIAILGVENWGSPPFMQYGDLQKALSPVRDTPFKILLSHDPTHWPEEVIAATNITLTLSGHTHGMQAGINLKNKKWSPIKYKYKHWAGLYREGKQYLYVNRGLGWLGFPGRLGMRPEITLIELFCHDYRSGKVQENEI